MTKYKIGDLVCLSAYGKARDYNRHLRGHWGIVVELNGKHNYPYQVKWLSNPFNWEEPFHPREIKHYKPPKDSRQ
jgi:hypothetical protein